MNEVFFGRVITVLKLIAVGVMFSDYVNKIYDLLDFTLVR